MYGPAPAARARFLSNQVSTASPATLLVMLYDRLVLDLARAEEAQRSGDRQNAHNNLVHAQEIVNELLATLDTSVWEGGPQLAALYGFMITEMIGANVSCDPERTASVRALVEPLQEAWRAAAAEVASGVAATA